MSNNEQAIEFPVALKPLLTDFVVHVLRERISSDRLSSYAARYFADRQHTSVDVSNVDDAHDRTGVFLVDRTNGIGHIDDTAVSPDRQRRKSVWGGSPVHEQADRYEPRFI
jgi:hypothetical protein